MLIVDERAPADPNVSAERWAGLAEDDNVGHRRLTIVQAIIHMAHALDYRIVAEGIETEAQRALLRELGCEFAQGYFFRGP